MGAKITLYSTRVSCCWAHATIGVFKLMNTPDHLAFQTEESMSIHPPCAMIRQRGMTLSEMLVFLACFTVAIVFSAFLGSSHHWVFGIIALPLGFCATATVFGLLGEVAVRRGYSRLARTSGAVIRRSLIGGTLLGLPLAAVFYYLAVRGAIPTITGGWHRALVSACAFGTSVALTAAFFLMLRSGTTPNPSTTQQKGPSGEGPS
jgi:hypothetical protein